MASLQIDDPLRKVDARARRRLRQGDLAGPMELLIVATKPAGQAEIEALRVHGCEIDSMTNDIISVRVSAEQIGRIAALDFVVNIEVSRPLYEEFDEEENHG